MWALAVIGMIASVIGAYYYLRVIQAMYFREASHDASALGLLAAPVSRNFKTMLLVVAALILLLGIWPTLVTDWLHY
jgi:NADH-quinone oxidoreductase subunit N